MLQVKYLLVIFGGLFAACSFFDSSTAKKTAPDKLFFVQKTNPETKVKTVGFMDDTGKIDVGPWQTFEWNGKKYEYPKYAGVSAVPEFRLMNFVEGMAGICFYGETKTYGSGVLAQETIDYDKAKCGFIDKTGKIVVEPKYTYIGFFSDGLAAVSESPDSKYSAKFGYIDKTGKQIIEQKHREPAVFNDGVVVVFADSGAYEGIDTTGKTLFSLSNNVKPSNYADGYTVGGKVVVDKTGKTTGRFESERTGNNDVKYRETYRGKNYFYGYTITDDRSLLPGFSDGLTMVSSELKSLPIGYGNAKGELEINLDPKIAGEIRPFSEGFAPVGWRVWDRSKPETIVGKGEVEGVYDWTFVDRKGDIKIKPDDTFRDARPFAEDLAAVMKRRSAIEYGGYWGFVNAEFKVTVPFCFESVSDFRGGLAKVKYESLFNDPKECAQYKSVAENGAVAGEFLQTTDSSFHAEFYIDKTGAVVKPQW